MILGSGELLGFQAQTLVALDFHRNAGRSLPAGAYQHEVHAARSLVVAPVAIAFIQRIVIQQTSLVARQFLLTVAGEFAARHGAVPQAELQHLTLIQNIAGIV